MLEMIPCFLNFVDLLFRSVQGNKSPLASMIGKTQLDAIIFSSNISIMTTEAVNSLFILKIFLLVSVKTSPQFFFTFP